nr:hypothetical protein [Bacilli bacterium]
ENVGYKALRYILAVVAMMGLSIFAVYGLSYLTDELVLMKFLVDSLILIASLAAAAIRVQFKARGRRKHESQSTNALRNSYDLD